MNAFVSILLAPVVGHFADKSSFRNGLLILAWAINIVGTAITALSTTCELLYTPDVARSIN
jgi:MFS-type transporter involved in bile tolerance (Atg22 family)